MPRKTILTPVDKFFLKHHAERGERSLAQQLNARVGIVREFLAEAEQEREEEAKRVEEEEAAEQVKQEKKKAKKKEKTTVIRKKRKDDKMAHIEERGVVIMTPAASERIDENRKRMPRRDPDSYIHKPFEE